MFKEAMTYNDAFSKLERIGKIIKKYFRNDYLSLCVMIGLKIDEENILRQIDNQIGILSDGFYEFAIKGITIEEAKKDRHYIEKNWPDKEVVKELKAYWESI